MTMEQAQALFAAHGCSLTEQQYAQLCRYETELVQYNEKVNLTAITESDAIWHKHFLDSAVILAQIELPQGAALLDVGTGAGFPMGKLKREKGPGRKGRRHAPDGL